MAKYPKRVTRKPLTPKQRKFIQGVISGKSQTDAAIEAYDTNSRASAASVGNAVMDMIAVKFPELMDKLGVNDERIVEVLNRGLDASTSYYSKSEKEMIEVADWHARLKAVDIALKLKSKYPKEKVESEHNYNFVITRGDQPVVTLEPPTPPE